MRGGARDIIGVVEAAYRVLPEETAWIGETLDAVEPHLADGLGSIACFFDREAAPSDVMSSIVIRGMDPRILLAMRGEFEGGTDADRARSLRLGGPVIRLTGLCGHRSILDSPAYGALAREIGFADVLAIRAANPDGTGMFLGAPVRAPAARGAFDRRWSRLAAHLAAGARLQRAASKLVADRASAADAVLTPGGRVLSAAERAHDALGLLRDAAVRIDRARTRAGRRDPDAALERWQALVDGRWSLVDHFESDGKRYVIAVENAPHAPDPRALAPNERTILHYAGMGHPNKLIAYELGIPEGTVATRILSIARKLGVRSRAELIARYQMLRRARFEAVDVDGASLFVGHAAEGGLPAGVLTAAEREVAALAARGQDNASIAKARRCSPRTVANLLQSAYRKLGVRSRSELARRAAGGG
jgi:DNA-binding CsgD family transcriptional regulator